MGEIGHRMPATQAGEPIDTSPKRETTNEIINNYGIA